ncbi:hypothetical protein K8R33_02850 [archaeon]|nr:hypothetical protein [archaeon]
MANFMVGVITTIVVYGIIKLIMNNIDKSVEAEKLFLSLLNNEQKVAYYEWRYTGGGVK